MHVVLEPLPQLERARDDVLVEAGEAKLRGVRIPHLLGRRDPGRGDEGEKRDAVGLHRGERRDPAALAVAPEPDALDADRVQHRERVAHLHVEAPPGRVARRLALAAAVERDDADAGRRKHSVQVLVQHPSRVPSPAPWSATIAVSPAGE